MKVIYGEKEYGVVAMYTVHDNMVHILWPKRDSYLTPVEGAHYMDADFIIIEEFVYYAMVKSNVTSDKDWFTLNQIPSDTAAGAVRDEVLKRIE